MAESSYEWTTSAAGDGASTYTRSDLTNRAKIFAAMMDDEGICGAYLNNMAGSVTGANTVQINTGGALVDGKPYYNSAAVNVNIPSASGGGNTRIDRVVLRADWTAQTVRITRIAGVDAASPSVPAITQTTGVTYDIKLYQALVNTSGTVTLTDERVFAYPGTDTIQTAAIQGSAVTTAKIAALNITTALIAADAVTPAKIPDRTRTFLVPAGPAYNLGGTIYDAPAGAPGYLMADGKNYISIGMFYMPADFVSGLTIQPVYQEGGAAGGNVFLLSRAYWGAAGENMMLSSVSSGNIAVAAALSPITTPPTTLLTMSGLAAGDYVVMEFNRLGTSGSDTATCDLYFIGWLISYTADS